MHLRSLIHIIEVINAMVHPKNIMVMGSSSLLAHDPRLGDPGGPLELSMDVDVLLDPCEDAALKMLHEAVGEGSMFHRESGVYADLMRPAIVSTLPAGWETRCVTLPGWPAVKCLDRYDLALVKLALGRSKDMALLKALVHAGGLDLRKLRERYQMTSLDERTMFKAGRRLHELDKNCDIKNGDGRTSGDSPSVVREKRVCYKARTASTVKRPTKLDRRRKTR